MSRKYPRKDTKILYSRAAGRCAFPACRKNIVLPEKETDEVAQIGKIGHIIAHKDGGPRGDPNMPEALRDTYSNWILLCGTCHDTVDTQPKSYSPAFLRNLKTEHETWVSQKLAEGSSDLTHEDLAFATKGIVNQSKNEDSSSFTVITPAEKIRKNNLSGYTRTLIATGLLQAHHVKAFLNLAEQLEEGFTKRLVGTFKAEYKALAKEPDLDGDAIFEELRAMATAHTTDFKHLAAGLALLTYLFERCEVLKK